MKILAVADEESRYYYTYYQPGRLREFDLILACGDLKPAYLEFLVTMADCPLYYVHGNHDGRFDREPEGCVCIDDRIEVFRGVRILGLGGSYRYRDGKYMFTERQMRRRIARLYYKIRRAGGVDIVVTHAPARHLGDQEDLAHRGFSCFTWLIDRFHPKYLVHGHVHRNYGYNIPRRIDRDDTVILNACGYTVFEIESR